MQGYAETLLIRNARLSEPEKRKYLGVLLDSTKKLSGLVDQLFQYAKLRS